MADRPILFSAPMIQSLLAGRKTQARRIMPYQKELATAYSPIVSGRCIYNYAGEELISKARIAVGDRLWVREHWHTNSSEDGKQPSDIDQSEYIWYVADGKGSMPISRFRHGMFMPRWASRLTLLVTDVRVQKLQEISGSDAIAEGIRYENIIVGSNGNGGVHNEETADRYWNGTEPNEFEGQDYAEDAYADLWDKINGPGAWDANPWVSAISFSVHRENIDRMTVQQMETAG